MVSYLPRRRYLALLLRPLDEFVLSSTISDESGAGNAFTGGRVIAPSELPLNHG